MFESDPSTTQFPSSSTARSASVTFHDPPASSVLNLPPRSSFRQIINPPAPPKGPQPPKSTFSSQAAPSRPALRSAREKQEEERRAEEEKRRAFYSSMPRAVFPAVCNSPSNKEQLPSPDQPSKSSAAAKPISSQPNVLKSSSGSSGPVGPILTASASSSSSNRDKQARGSAKPSSQNSSSTVLDVTSSSGAAFPLPPNHKRTNTDQHQRSTDLNQDKSKATISSTNSSIPGKGLTSPTSPGLLSAASQLYPPAHRKSKDPKEITGMVASHFRPSRPPSRHAGSDQTGRSRLDSEAGAARSSRSSSAPGAALSTDLGRPEAFDHGLDAAASAAAEAVLRSRSTSRKVYKPAEQPQQDYYDHHPKDKHRFPQEDAYQKRERDQYSSRQQQEERMLREKHRTEEHQQQRCNWDQHVQHDRLVPSPHQQQQQQIDKDWRPQQQQQQQSRGRGLVPIIAGSFSHTSPASATALHDREVPYWQMAEQLQEHPSYTAQAHYTSSSRDFHSHPPPYHPLDDYNRSQSTPTSCSNDYKDALDYPTYDKPPPLPELRVHVPHSCVKAASDSNSEKALRQDMKGQKGRGPGGQVTGGSTASSSCMLVPPGSNKPLPRLSQQLSLKALVVGLLVGFCFALLMQRMALVTGLVPGFQVRVRGAGG